MKTALYSTPSVVNSILDICDENQHSVNELMIHRYLYLCHGLYLALTGWPLFHDDIKATPFGPVILSVWTYYFYANYHEGKKSLDMLTSNHRIPETVDKYLFKFKIGKKLIYPRVPLAIRTFIEGVIKGCIPLSPDQLRKMCGIENGPWHTIYNRYKISEPRRLCNDHNIPNNLIEKHFSSQFLDTDKKIKYDI